MAASLHSLRIPEALESELERELERRGATEWSAGVLGILEEALRMSRAPGVVFVEGRGGRRAAIAHSGLEVWEIIATWKEGAESWDTLREAYPELSDLQLRAAVNYYRLYPAEIDARLSRETAWTAERVAGELPFSRVPAQAGDDLPRTASRGKGRKPRRRA